MDIETPIAGLVLPRGAGSTTRWTTLWEADLRTLPDQAILASNSSGGVTNVTIGGAPWLIHAGGSQGSGQPTLAVKNGVGLVCWYQGLKHSGNTYLGFHCDVKVTLLTGFDPQKATCCQVRFYRGPLLNVGGYTYANDLSGIAAVGSSIWSGTENLGMSNVNNETLTFDPTSPPTLTLRNAYWTELARLPFIDRPAYGGLDSVSEWVFATAVSPWSGIGGTNPDLTDSHKDRNLRSHLYQRNVFGASLPEIEDMQTAFTSVQSADGEALANHKMGAYFGSTGVNACALTQIRVLQRPIRTL